MCPFSVNFFCIRLIVLPLQGFEVTHPIFDKLRKRLPDAFHLVQTIIFTAKRSIKLLWKTPNLTYLAVKTPVGKSGCEQRLVNCDSPTGYDMQNTIYESMVLLIRWWMHWTVCLTALCLLILLKRWKHSINWAQSGYRISTISGHSCKEPKVVASFRTKILRKE